MIQRYQQDKKSVPVVGFFFLVTFLMGTIFKPAIAQKESAVPEKLVFVDEAGVLKYTDSGDEAAFFGVNYSPPFAHSYRAIKRLGKSHKEAIDKDAYHFARLGFDGFRIHVWDTEISDSLGNLVNNKHLDLLDYMLAKFRQRGIKIILTPLNFYNNGYPEPPTPTDGFANYISKGDAPVKKEFWPVVNRYLEQFINHKNPYTGKTYRDDSNIIAMEIVNEPSHGGNQDTLTSYVNMLADHLRENGWEKPIFYNISQNPPMAEGVMNADIDGTSFQWYPAGLVGGSAIQKNYLPYVDEYTIPFKSGEAFQEKAQMVYEFDSADFLGSYAYPAMARSFREAGFQWATQFAYDPLDMGHVNTDYRTHYLNMIYTPSKAVSMKIASTAFHKLPRGDSYGRYPDNNSFGDFRVSHEEKLSEFNTDMAFFYSSDTQTSPKDAESLRHVAGVGSSPIVSYRGTGAYFLDRVEDGIWRLEVMPDAIHIRDPFATTALDKQLTWIEWKEHPMTIHVSNLGSRFHIRGINAGNDKEIDSGNGAFSVTPGTYLLIREDKNDGEIHEDRSMGNVRLNEFVAPKPTKGTPVVSHKPNASAVAGESVQVTAVIAGLKPEERVHLLVQSGWQPQRIPMEETVPYTYRAQIQADNVNAGYLTYWITVEHKDQTLTFPGGFEGRPSDWDYYHDKRWRIPVFEPGSPVVLFEGAEDFQNIDYAFYFWNSDNSLETVSTDSPGSMTVRVSSPGEPQDRNQALGWKVFVGDRLKGRNQSIEKSDRLVVKAKGRNGTAQTLKAIVVTKDGSSYSSSFSISDTFEPHRISFSSFEPDSMMLLPRPYPPFMRFWFQSAAIPDLNPANIEEIQFVMPPGDQSEQQTYSFEIESVWIEPNHE